MSDVPQSPAAEPEKPEAVVPVVPAAEPVPTPEPASPGAEQAPAPETSSPQEAGAATDQPEAEPSLLEKFAKDREEKSAEEAKGDQPDTKKPEDGEKPAEGDKSAEEAAKPEEEPKPELPKVDYKYDLPETIKMDDGQKEEFHKALDAFRADPEKGATELLGMADKAFQTFADHLVKEQWKTFNETRKEWRTQLMADPVLGGAGHDTAMGVVARMRDKFVSDAKAGTPEYDKDLKDFDQFLRVTGAGDNPLFLRFLHRVGRLFDEPPMPPPGARPVPDGGRRPGESRGSRMYPTMQSDSQS